MSLNSNNSNQSVGFKNSCKALCLAAVLVSGALTLGHAATAAIKPKPPAVVTVKRLTNGHFQLLVDKAVYY